MTEIDIPTPQGGGESRINCPTWLAQSEDIFGEGNFPQGCSFSPDGLCVATATAADSTLRLYNTIHAPTHENEHGNNPEPQSWKTALASNVVGEVIRSFDWYPLMQSSNPATCCLAATGRDQPIQLIDAYTGGIRATYVPMNAMDEMESPTVVRFSPLGDTIVAAGFRSQRMIQVFDSASPGKSSATVHSLGKTKRSRDGQKGLVSALAFSTSTAFGYSLLAVGTYSPGSIYLYDFRTPQPTGTIWNSGCCIVGHGKKQHANRKRRFDSNDDEPEEEIVDEGGANDFFSQAKTQWYAHRAQRGITQLEFDADGKLYSASRNTDAILVWDVRMLSGNPEYTNQPIRGYNSYPINAQTNQRLEFALDSASSRLWVGGFPNNPKSSPSVRVYDTSASAMGDKLIQELPIPGCAMGDAINGLSYNATYDMLAVATGSRRFPNVEDYADSDAEEDGTAAAKDTTKPGSLQLYKWNSPAKDT